MKRDLVSLAATTYDVVIIGGGIYGAATAWEATLRGLSVALVERGDFGGGASANSLKTIHGGLRYLQSADFQRMRHSIHERTTLLRIAPHLVHVLPVLVPTYGHGMKGREAMSAAIRVNDLLSFDRNRGLEASKHIPNAHMISKAETLALAPGINAQGLNGGCVFYDAQAFNTERLTLAFLRSAENIGASLANYVEAIEFLCAEEHVAGVRVRDQITSEVFEIRAQRVINTAGAWTSTIDGWLQADPPPPKLAKAINVVTRPLFKTHAVGVSGGGRLYFVSPWRGQSLIGTDYSLHSGDPTQPRVTEREVADLLAAINSAIPAACLTPDDVSFVHRGLLPIDGVDARGTVKLSQHPRIIDSGRGVISVEGVKYTTARGVAQHAVDLLFKSLERSSPPSVSAVTPLYGGALASFADFRQEQLAHNPHQLSISTVERLAMNYGSEYRRVLSYYERGDLPETLAVLRAEIKHAVKREMALTLADVVLRRTDLGSAAPPSESYLRFAARVMSAEFGWTDERITREIDAVRRHYKLQPDPQPLA